MARLNINDLPEEVLILILSRLDVYDRFATAVLVCRRWAGLMTSPQLLQTLDSIYFQDPWMPLVNTFLFKHREFLHLRELDLSWDDGVAADELAVALTACGNGLTRLEMQADELTVGSWVHATSRLQELQLTARQALHLRVPLTPLTALRKLELWSPPLEGFEDAQLPVSLTEIDLTVTRGDMTGAVHSQLPRQLSALTQLEKLVLMHTNQGPGRVPSTGYDALVPLAPTLKTLFVFFHHTPNILSALTGLKSLVIDVLTPQDEQLLEAGLRSLRQLERLNVDKARGAPPRALAALTQLKSLQWGTPFAPQGELPAGQWLNSLQTLQVHPIILLNSLDYVSESTSLRLVHVNAKDVHATCELLDKLTQQQWFLQVHVTDELRRSGDYPRLVERANAAAARGAPFLQIYLK